jgi:hypothetical protein
MGCPNTDCLFLHRKEDAKEVYTKEEVGSKEAFTEQFRMAIQVALRYKRELTQKAAI